jgi:hypothetical protein
MQFEEVTKIAFTKLENVTPSKDSIYNAGTTLPSNSQQNEYNQQQ